MIIEKDETISARKYPYVTKNRCRETGCFSRAQNQYKMSR